MNPRPAPMSLSKKLHAALLLPLLTLVIAVGVCLFTFGRLGESATESVRLDILSHHVSGLLLLAREREAAVLLPGGEVKKRGRLKSELERIDRSFREELDLGSKMLSGGRAAQLHDIEREWRESAAVCEKIAEGAESDAERAMELFETQFAMKNMVLDDFLQELRYVSATDKAGLLATDEMMRRRATALLAVLAGGGGVVSLVVAFMVIRRVTGTLDRLAARMRANAAGFDVLAARAGDSGEPPWEEFSASTADLADIAEDLGYAVTGGELEKAPVAAGAAVNEQYEVWSALPADVRSALVILARRLGRDKDSMS